jgi:hypothetical protein
VFFAGAIVGLYLNSAAMAIHHALRAMVEVAQENSSVHPLRTWRTTVIGGGISTTSGEQLSAFAISRLQWSIQRLGRQWQHVFDDKVDIIRTGQKYRYSRPAALKHEYPRRQWQKTRLYRWWNRWAATTLLRRAGRLLQSGRVALWSEIGTESIHDFDDPAFTLAYALNLRYYRGLFGRRKSEQRIAAMIETAKASVMRGL